MSDTGLAKRCVCGHRLGWHQDLDGECGTLGCDCQKFEGVDHAVALTQAPPGSGLGARGSVQTEQDEEAAPAGAKGGESATAEAPRAPSPP